jgi:hypothetical protein
MVAFPPAFAKWQGSQSVIAGLRGASRGARLADWSAPKFNPEDLG